MVGLKNLLLRTLELVEEEEYQEDEASSNLSRKLLEYLQMHKGKLPDENIPSENDLKVQNIPLQNIESNEEIKYGNVMIKETEGITKIREVAAPERIKLLSGPKQISPVMKRASAPFQIPKAALKYKASCRIRRLAVPVERDISELNRRGEVFQVKRSALTARCSQRLRELAKPARSSSPQQLPSFHFYPPVQHKKRLTIKNLQAHNLAHQTKIKSV